MNIKKSVWVLSCASALALAACGGSSSGGLSNAQLQAKVNAACKSYNTAVSKIQPPSDFTTNAVAAAAYLDKVKPLVQGEYNAIESLKPSGSLKSDFARYLADGKHQLALFNTVLAKAHAKDRSGLADLQAMASYKQSTLTPLDRKLGFTECSG
jgi:hypothetical protein